MYIVGMEGYWSKLAHIFRFGGAVILLVGLLNGLFTGFETDLSMNFYITGSFSMFFGVILEAVYHVREEELWI